MKAYRPLMTRMGNKEVDFNSDSLFWTLHTVSYVPNFDTHQNVSDLTNELTTAGGYTVGGIAVGTPAMTYTAANSWGNVRANSTAYVVGDVYRPAATNGFVYRCVVAGTSAGAPPTFGLILGGATVDGTATFELVGSGINAFTCTNPSWPTATFGPCRYAVLSDRQTGVAATEPLIGLIDFLADKTAGGGTFQITVHPTQGVLTFFMP
jgi:hypothetical protein